MIWKVEFDDAAVKELRKLDRSIQQEILRYFREHIATEEDPRRFGKKLSHNFSSLWRYPATDRMNLIFSSYVWEDYLYWQETDKSTVKRIHTLIKTILQALFEGIGKPEPLEHGLADSCSRRINDAHRIVYKNYES